MINLHHYGDWIKNDEGNVGVILDERQSTHLFKTYKIRWNTGLVCWSDDHDLITEHEYFKVVDPSKCGPDIETIIAGSLQGRSEDFFLGGFRLTRSPIPKEDYFQ